MDMGNCMTWNYKHCVYVLCEEKEQFTTHKNKCKSLYIGQTKDWSQRHQKYQNIKLKNNEIIRKLAKHFKIKIPDMSKKADLRNIKVRMLISNNLVDNDYREEMESYLIKKLNPLLNIAKRDGIFERNYKKFKKNYSITTFEKYREDCEHYFSEWYFSRKDIGGTETIFHPIKKIYVDRSSLSGEEAEDIQYNRKYKNWFWKTNELQHRYELWRTNQEKWEKELKFR